MVKPQLGLALIGAVVGTIWLSNCTGERSPVGPETPESRAEALVIPNPPPQHPVVERVAARIEAVGPFSPGLPIVLVAGGKANRPAENTTLDVLSLDEDLAGTSLAQRPGRDRPLKTLASSLTKGGQFETTTSLTFSAPGYYRVLAQIKASSAVPAEEGDSIILDQSDRTLWILVDEKGGGLTEGWDSLALAGRQPKFGAYGPFVPVTSIEGDTEEPNADDVASASTLATYAYSGRITYFNRPIARRDPVPDMQVTLSCGFFDGLRGLIFDQSSQVRTDANGNWSATCPSNRPQAQMSANHFNSYAAVKGKDGAFAGVGFFDSNGGVFPDLRVANDDAAVTFLILTRRVPQAFSKFGRSRSAIEVWVRNDDTTDYRPKYETGPDRIKTNFQRTFPPGGQFTTNHEYGHAFHWKAIEAPAQIDCGDSHSIGVAETLSCAFAEGFADFFGVWIPGDSLTSAASINDHTIETNPFRDNGDGSIIEGAVAGFFYDLVDGITGPERDNATNTGKFAESFDNVTYPASYLAQLMQTCAPAQGSLVISRLDGIDEFIYCAERSLSAQSLTQYFPTRVGTFTSFTEGATEPPSWSSAAIRDLWELNLYNVPFP